MPLRVPADSVASTGTPVTVTDIGSLGLNGVSLILSATVPPSFTVSEAGADKDGATGSAAPITWLIAVALWGLAGSLVVATTRMKEPTSDACTT